MVDFFDYFYCFGGYGCIVVIGCDDYICDLIEQVLFISFGECVMWLDFGSGLMVLVFEFNSIVLVVMMQMLVQGVLQ